MKESKMLYIAKRLSKKLAKFMADIKESESENENKDILE